MLKLLIVCLIETIINAQVELSYARITRIVENYRMQQYQIHNEMIH